MNKLYAWCAIACCVSVGVRAQAQGRGNPQPAAAANERRYVVPGCVSRETPPATGAAPQFLITDNRGDKPVVYRLVGDVNDLTFHVGHTVEVSGPLSAPASSATGPNAKALVLKVATLSYLSPTCINLNSPKK